MGRRGRQNKRFSAAVSQAIGREQDRNVPSTVSSAVSSAFTSAESTPWPSPWTSRAPSRATSPVRHGVFRFLELPAELRLKIYEMVLYNGKVVDLDPVNYRLLHPRLALFLVNKQMYDESYPTFYSQSLRLFPYHGRFFHTKMPLLVRLPSHYRACINTLELRLGPGWSAPPRCQKIDAKMQTALRDCNNLRMLKLFIEIDPSDTIFTGFRGKNSNEDTYKYFCIKLLQSLLLHAHTIESVEIDAYPGVKKEAPLVMALKRVVKESGRDLVWGPLRGWEKESDEPGLIGLEMALAGMGISDVGMAGRVVEVQA